MNESDRQTFTDEEALAFHKYPRPGKIAIAATKPMATQRDLSLAYSPGKTLAEPSVGSRGYPG